MITNGKSTNIKPPAPENLEETTPKNNNSDLTTINEPNGENLHHKKQQVIEEYNRKVSLLNFKKVILLDKYEQKLNILIGKKTELLTKLVRLHTPVNDRVNQILFAASKGMLPNFHLSDYQNLSDQQRAALADELSELDKQEPLPGSKSARLDWTRQQISQLSEEDRYKLQQLSDSLKIISIKNFKEITTGTQNHPSSTSKSGQNLVGDGDEVKSETGMVAGQDLMDQHKESQTSSGLQTSNSSLQHQNSTNTDNTTKNVSQEGENQPETSEKIIQAENQKNNDNDQTSSQPATATENLQANAVQISSSSGLNSGVNSGQNSVGQNSSSEVKNIDATVESFKTEDGKNVNNSNNNKKGAKGSRFDQKFSSF